MLAQGTASTPTGVTVDLAREVADRLSVPLGLVCFDAARASFEALTTGTADVGFLAVEPARAEQVTFTAPYVLIEGVYVVRSASAVTGPADVDREGVRIGVKQGSAYDLFLTRTLQHATLVRGAEGVDVFVAQGLEAGAGIRQPVTAFAAERDDVRVVEQRFMEIRQAVAVPARATRRWRPLRAGPGERRPPGHAETRSLRRRRAPGRREPATREPARSATPRP